MTTGMAVDGRESGYAFCSNPACQLHVRAGDPGVEGAGNWAQLANGLIIGRGIYQGAYFCDSCGRALMSGAVNLEIAEPPPKPRQAELGLQRAIDFEVTSSPAN